MLDLKVTNATSPTTTDGLLIPRVTAFPSPVTAAQNGMLVFLTSIFGTNQVGLYFYDFPSLTWKWISSVNNSSVWVNNNISTRVEIPKQSDGITNRPVGNEIVVLDNGNIGFGTLTPARNFQVTRDFNDGVKSSVSNPNAGNQAFAQFTVEAKGNSGYLYSINDTYPFSATYPWFTAGNTLLQSTGVGGLSLGGTNTNGIINFFTGGRDESMRISAAGNVGIGTKLPVSPIHISGSSASILLERFGNGSHFVGRSANGTQLAPTPLLTNDIATRLSGWGYNGTSYWPVGIIDIIAEENQTTTAAGGYIKFTTNDAGSISSSEKMRITSTGNVGIGTTTPTNKLDVVGNIKSEKATTGDFTSIELNSKTSGIPKITFHPSDNSERFNIKLTANSTTANDLLSFNSTTINNALVIKGDGNVGIFNSIPTEKLDITGNLKVSGAIMPNNIAGTIGQVLVSSGVGVAPIWDSNPVKPYKTTGAASGIYNVTLSEYTIRVFNAVSEVKLPTAIGNQGKIFIIIGSNGISSKTWSTFGGSIYDDVTNSTITTISGSQRYTVQSDGTDWIVIGR